MIHAVDYDELERTSGRFELQSELFLDRSENSASCVGRGSTASSLRRGVELRESQIEVEAAGQPCSIDDWPTSKQRQHAGKRCETLTATDDFTADL